MVPIIKKKMPITKVWRKCPYKMKPTCIVVHNTANDATAQNEVSYMQRNNNAVSFHFAVDDKEIVQGVELNRNSWNAGDGSGKGNRQGISIEICYSKSGGERFIKAEKNAVDLIVKLLKDYGWGIDKVTKHQDYNGKYCPHRTLDMGWNRFVKMIQDKLEDKPISKPSTNKKSVTTIAKEVLAGKWGNGDTRKSKLKKAGYNYKEVQAKVNEVLYGKKSASKPKKSINVIAKEVVRGEWGNGAERKERLKKAGYDYKKVQKRVNELI